MSSLPSNMRVEIPSIPIVLHWTCRPGVPSRSHLLWFAVQRSGAWCTGLVDAPFHKSFLQILLAEMTQSYSASNLYVSLLAAAETSRACWVMLVATWTWLDLLFLCLFLCLFPVVFHSSVVQVVFLRTAGFFCKTYSDCCFFYITHFSSQLLN